MSSPIFFENKKYISAKDAGLLTGYTKDYVGQLCRQQKISSKRIGRVWYVSEEAIINYKNFSSEVAPENIFAVNFNNSAQTNSNNISAQDLVVSRDAELSEMLVGDTSNFAQDFAKEVIQKIGTDFSGDVSENISSVNSGNVPGRNSRNIFQQISNDIFPARKILEKSHRVANRTSGAFRNVSKSISRNIATLPRMASTFATTLALALIMTVTTYASAGFVARSASQMASYTLPAAADEVKHLGNKIYTAGVAIGSSILGVDEMIANLGNLDKNLAQNEKSRVPEITIYIVYENLGSKLYATLSDITDMYSISLLDTYLAVGDRLGNLSTSFHTEVASITTSPKDYILAKLSDSLGLASSFIKDIPLKIANFANPDRFLDLFAGFSEPIGFAKKPVKGLVGAGAGLPLSLALVSSAPVDSAGTAVYNAVNNFFTTTLYSPFTALFDKSNKNNKTANNVQVNGTSATLKKPSGAAVIVVQTPAPLAPKKPVAVVVPLAPKQNTSPVVIERIIERVPTIQTALPKSLAQSLSGYVTSADLDKRLSELNNNLASKFYAQTSGSGGNVTNIYQQIAGSQVNLSQLNSPAISNPTITGGSLTGVSINNLSSLSITGALSAGDTTLGTTTVTNLIVSNTSTSTFAGGIAVSSGCVSVNGTCLGTGGGGSGTPGGADTQVQYNNAGGFGASSNFVWDNTNARLGIGTSSPYATLSVGGTVVASSYISTSTATSTFAGGISTNLLSVTSTIASSTFSNGINLLAGCFSVNGTCLGGGSSLTFTYPLVNSANTISLAFGTTTANSWSALQTFAYSSSTYGSFTTASSTNLVVNGSSFNNLLGSGLTLSSGALTVSAGVSNISNYDFTFGTTYDTANLTSTSTKPWWAQGGLNASSTSHFNNASTTVLSVSGNSYLGTISGGTWNGSTIAAIYGGTGNATYVAGDILYATDASTLTRLPKGSDGTVLKIAAGLPAWGTDITSGGGGGSTAWATTSDSLAIYPTDTSDVLILGGTATTTTGNILEVIGNSKFGGSISVTGNASTSLLSAHRAYFGGTATTTIDNAGNVTLPSAGLLSFPYSSSTSYSSFTTASTTNLIVNGQSFNNLLGTGLQNSGGALTLNATGDWTGTIDGNNFVGGAIGVGEIIYGGSAGSFSELAAGTPGHILMSGGSGAPSWVATTTFSGGLTYSAGNVTNTLTAGDGLTRTVDDFDCDTASGSVFGCLSSADWTTFNSKLSSYDAWTHPLAGFSATTSSLVIGASSTPTAKLTISSFSEGASTANLFEVASSTGSLATSTYFVINSLGNVGIGVAVPTLALQVRKDLNANSGVLIQNGTAGTGAAAVLQVQSADSTGSLQVFPSTYIGATQFADRVVLGAGTSATGLDLVSEAATGNFKIYTGGVTTGNERLRILSTGAIGIGTTTPYYSLTIASSTDPQFALSDTTGIAQWAFRNAGGNLYLATTTVAGTATTSISALEISGSGFGTTTVRGLNIAAQATTTSNVGFNLATGCFAVNGTCLTNSTAIGNVGSGTAGQFPYYAGTGTTLTATSSLFIDTNGSVGIGTAVPGGRLHIAAKNENTSALILDTGASANPWAIQFARDGVSTASVHLASNLTLGWQASLNPYSDNSTSYTLGTPSFRWNSLSVGTGASVFGGTVGISGAANLTSTLNVSGQTTLGQASSTQLSAYRAYFGGTATTTITNAGYVGIGTSSPFAQLSINNEAGVVPLAIGSTTATSFIVDKNGNVGIGTTSPYAKLSISTVGQNIVPLAIQTNGSAGNYTATSSAIFIRDAAGTELLRIFASDPEVTNNYNSGNLFIGYKAGISNPTDNISAGFYNTGIGFESLASTTLGDYNTALGFQALKKNTTGNQNTALGNLALYNKTGGNASIGIGSYAGLGTSSGYTSSGIIAIGDWAGYSLQTGSDYNTLLGYNSGYGITTGSRNIFIGQSTIDTSYNQVTTGSRNISIGNDVAVPSATANNQLNIGNAIYGTGLDGTLTTLSNAALSIGTSTNTNIARLTLASSTASQLSLSDTGGVAQWTFRNAGGDLFFSTTTVAGTATTSTSALTVSGSGFGTTTVRGLSIIGQATSTSNVGFNLTGGCFAISGICIRSATGNEFSSYDAWTHPFAGISATTSALSFPYSSSTIYSSFITASTTNLIVNGSSFNNLLGSGLSLSSGALTNAGVLSVAQSSGSAQTGAITFATSTTAIANDWGITNSSGTFTFNIPNSTASVRGLLTGTDWTTFNNKLGSYDAWTHPAAGQSATTSLMLFNGQASSTQFSANTAYFGGTATSTFTNSGYLGIATSTPFAQLSINNEAGLTPFVVGSSTATSFIVDQSGNIGVGTASSISQKLSVNGNLLLQNSGNSLMIGSGSSRTDIAGGNAKWTFNLNGSFRSSISDFSTPAGSSNVFGLNTGGINLTNAGNETGNVYLLSTSTDFIIKMGASPGTERLRLTNTGNLSLGTTTPAWQLQVATSSGAGFRPQFTLTDTAAASNAKHWNLSSLGGNLYIGTSTDTYATTSISALEISGSGFGTTTVRGLNIAAQATTTSNVGLNVTTGCFAVNGTCLTNSTAIGNVGSGTAGQFPYYAGTGTTLTATSSLFIDTNGSVGIGTAVPGGRLHIAAKNENTSALILDTGASANPWAIQFARDGVSTASVHLASNLTLGWQASLNPYSDNSTSYTLGTPSFRWNSIAVGTGLSSFAGNVGFGGDTTPDFAVESVGTLAVSSAAGGDGDRFLVNSSGLVGIGTTTPTNKLTIADSSAPQLTLSDTTGIAQWAFRNAGGNLYFATTTVAGNATTSTSALTINGTTGALSLATSTAGCLNTSATGVLYSATCASGGGGSDPFSHFNGVNSATTTSFAIGTTTASNYQLTVSSSTAPQLSLSDGAGVAQWTQRNAGGNLYFATTTVAGNATTSTSALTINGANGYVGLRGVNTPTAALTLPNSTAAADGIAFGPDVSFYRSNSNKLTFAASGGTGTFELNAQGGGGGSVVFQLSPGTGAASFVDQVTNGTGLYFRDQYINYNLSILNDNTGRIGVASTTPFGQLSVESQAGRPGFVVGSSTRTDLIVDKNGKVGIGTANPSQALHVSSNSTTASTTLRLENLASNGSTAIEFWESGFASSALTLGYDATRNAFDISSPLSGTIPFTVLRTGFVGIGTTTPASTLAIQGVAGSNIFSLATSTGASILTVSEWGGIIHRVSSSTAFSVQMASGTPVFEIDTTNSNSNAGLDITAATAQTSNLLNFYSSGGSFLSGFTAAGGLFMNVASTTALNLYDGSGNAAFVVNSTGKSVGIGTSTLSYALTVQDSQASNYVARINNAAADTTADGLLISLGVANASRTTSNYFIGFSDGAGTVAGKIQGGASAVAYTTTAADLAEYFRIADLNDAPKAGEIVMLDGASEKAVRRAKTDTYNVSSILYNADANASSSTNSNTNSNSSATTTPVMREPLGIVSTNSGFIGNGPICKADDTHCDENYAAYNVLVAIAGQVPVKVSFENGPIAVGDYLTLSSTTPGVAAKLVGSGYIVGQVLSEATTTDMFGNPQEPMVNVFVKSGWRDTVTEDGRSSMWDNLLAYLKELGLEIGNGFVKITKLIAGSLVADKVETKELCIEDVCVTKDKLQALLLNSSGGGSTGGGSSVTPPPPPAEVPPADEPAGDDGGGDGDGDIATTTPDIIPPVEDDGIGTATTTPEVVVPAEEPVASTNPEVVPQVVPPPVAETPAPPVVEPVVEPESVVETVVVPESEPVS